MDQDQALISWPEEGVTRAPFMVYSDPAVYEAEMTRIFRGAIWHYLGLEVEIPETGDYRLMEVGDTPVIVMRNGAGEISALVNRCAHRGTMLLFEPFGNAKELMCVYHNWLFDMDGNLQSVPFDKGINGKGGMPESFRKSDHGLDRMRVETFNGLIFGTFNDDIEPLRDYLGPQVVGSFERIAGREFRVLGYYSQWLSSNWKLYCENATDPYHATILHAWATKLKLNRLTMEGAIEMGHEGWDREGWHQLSWSKMTTDKGGEVYDRPEFRSGTGSFDAFGLHDTSVIEHWDECGDGITTFIQTVFPNFVFQQIFNTLATRVLVPRGPEASELIWTILGFADDDDEQTAGRLKQGNLIGPSGFISLEDGMVGSLVQRGLGGGRDKATVMEMDGRSIETIRNSRASECGVRGLWTAYRALMGV
jgi:phenylpropionate dioxygenase-like ring-hydroxylating dioxygenase large terminal subunit